jgi:tripartite-type tricarboxylate transporter receptor subunit TctC
MTNSKLTAPRRAAALLALSVAVSACGNGGGTEGEGEDGAFPTRDVRLTVPYSPGGGYDTQARVIAPCLEKYLPGNPTVIVDNRPGAEGLQALQQAYNAEPDGHTLVQVGLSGAIIQQFVNPDRVKYDVGEMSWVGQYQRDVRALGVDPSLNIESWDDLAALAKERPIRFGGTGEGSPPSTEALAVSEVLDLPATVIQYEGSNEILGAFIRNEVDAVVLNYTSLLRWQQDEEVEILLVLDEERNAGIPDVKTATEAGVPEDDFSRLMNLPLIGTARAFAAPPGTPEEQLQILRDAFSDCMQDDDFVAYTKEPTSEVIYGPMSGEEFDEFVDEQTQEVADNLDVITRLYS